MMNDHRVIEAGVFAGQFGRVFKGFMLDDDGLTCGTVAIKTLKCKHRPYFVMLDCTYARDVKIL